MIGVFKSVKKNKKPKRRLMLYIDQEMIDDIDSLKPRGLTTQEAIRQILAYHIEETKTLNGL